MGGALNETRHVMPDIVVRRLEPDLIERLKRQAAANGRSMEAEARAILEAGVSAMTMAEWVAEMERLRSSEQSGIPTDVSGLIRDGHDDRDRTIGRTLGLERDETDR